MSINLLKQSPMCRLSSLALRDREKLVSISVCVLAAVTRSFFFAKIAMINAQSTFLNFQHDNADSYRFAGSNARYMASSVAIIHLENFIPSELAIFCFFFVLLSHWFLPFSSFLFDDLSLLLIPASFYSSTVCWSTIESNVINFISHYWHTPLQGLLRLPDIVALTN